ncbi:hypothetical protein, partial [Massilia agilis]
MKHASHLILAGALLAAVLTAFGGSSSNASAAPAAFASTAPAPSGTAPSGLNRQLLATARAYPASLTGLRSGAADDRLSSLALVRPNDGSPWQVCTERTPNRVVCATIEAAPPQARIIEWSEGDTLVLAYTPLPGTTLDSAAVQEFERAVGGAARAVVEYSQGLRRDGSARHNACDDQNQGIDGCGDDDGGDGPVVVVNGGGGDGGDGGGDGGGGGG